MDDARERAAHPPTAPGDLPPDRRPTDLGENAGVRMLIPVGRSGWAIAAGYAGLFAVLTVTAPIAIILGIIAVIHIRRDPRRHGMGRAIFAIVMGTIFTIVLAFTLAGTFLVQ